VRSSAFCSWLCVFQRQYDILQASIWLQRELWCWLDILESFLATSVWDDYVPKVRDGSRYLSRSTSFKSSIYPLEISSLRSFSMLASNCRTASSLVSDWVIIINRLSMSACCLLKASACCRTAFAWSFEALVAFSSASWASAS
jgi:hypothetical protein